MKKDYAHYINKIIALQRKEETESIKRYALFPILDEQGYSFYQQQEIQHWSATELEFIADRKWYDGATPEIKILLDTILAFFLAGDGAISDNIIFRFLLECKSYEEKAMFISQLHIELIHAETYGLAALTFKRDPNELALLLQQIDETKCVERKITFMEKWMLSDKPRYARLLAFACAEGIFFCNLFAVIFWFRSKGWFPNFIFANELISKDESLHRDYGAYLFLMEIAELLEDTNDEDKSALIKEIKDCVDQIISDAVEIEDEFSDYILQSPIEDLNKKDLKIYTRLIADSLLVQLKYPVTYNVRNPFTWLNDISMEQKSNFYEVRVGAYQKKSLADVLNWKKRTGLIENNVSIYTSPEEIDF